MAKIQTIGILTSGGDGNECCNSCRDSCGYMQWI